MNKRRLLKLASYLEKTRFTKKHRFNFAVVTTTTECGTAGCAIGEFPRVFPGAFKYLADGATGVVKKSQNEYVQSYPALAAEFMGITVKEAMHLFYPSKQCPESYGGEMLFSDATPKQVAANIRAFVKKETA